VTGTPRLRAGTEDDAEGLARAHHAAVRGTAAAFYPPEVVEAWARPSDAISGEPFRRAIQGGDELFVVAEQEGQVVGFGSIVPTENEVRAVYIDPRVGRRGIGSQILGELERLARTRDIRTLHLVASLNAEAFYVRHGYQVVERGVHRSSSGVAITCVRMRKSLIASDGSPETIRPGERPPMNVVISEEPIGTLEQHAGIGMAFVVDRVLDLAVRDHGLGGFPLSERALEVPYIKDYDGIEGEGPLSWPHAFDVTRWGLLVARAEGRRVGGAVIAFDTKGVDMLEGRKDLAVLWDIRVSSEARRGGVGARLFEAAESWARARGCNVLKVETQNVNVPACRFYARQGCALGAIHRFAYPDPPEEIMLLWYKDLTGGRAT
jgi:GNAT superfamily N-acetyltransferase